MTTVRLRRRGRNHGGRTIGARPFLAVLSLGLAITVLPTAAARAAEPVAPATTSLALATPPATAPVTPPAPPASAPATAPATAMPPSWEAAPGPTPAPAAAAPPPSSPAAPDAYARRRVDPWSGQAPPSPPPRPPVEVITSYGWQIVLADLGGLLGTGLLGGAGVDGLALVAPYFLASPIVHVAHGNTSTAFGSLGVHLGMPVVGIIVAAVATRTAGHQSEGEGLAAIAVGAMGGMVAATVIDAAFLAHSTVEAPPQVALVPTIAVARAGGATVGLAATF